jgi:hypothetical protein
MQLLTLEEFKKLTSSEIAEYVRGVGRESLTEEQRDHIFGDCNPDRALEGHMAVRAALIERLDNGLPLSKADKATARRYKRGDQF